MEKSKMKNEKLKIRLRLFTLVAFIALFVNPLVVQAFSLDEFFDDFEEWFSDEEWLSEEWFSTSTTSTQVINEVRVSANTGGNTADEGEVKEGETKTEIYVKNIINGTEIDPIEIESEANEVKVESEIKVEDSDKAIVHREIQIDSEKTVEDYEVDLEDSVSDIDDSGEIEEEEEEIEEIEKEGALKETLDVFQGWWSDFTEGLKSFFQTIFNIF